MSGSNIELLEGRRLLSGASLSDGVLRVRGDDDVNDTITLRLSADTTQVVVNVNAADIGSFNRADITRITVNGKSGNDDISIDQVNGKITGASIAFYGGAGNDTLTSGSDKMKIFGEDGHDRIRGRGYLDGGAGNDTIVGSNATDYIFGRAGRDSLVGGAGKDFIFGGTGNDTIRGGDGNDVIFGEDGDDVLHGQAGFDQVYGNDGYDAIYGGDDDDTLYGGDKEDLLHGDRGVDFKDYGEYAKIEKIMASHIAKSKTYVT